MLELTNAGKSFSNEIHPDKNNWLFRNLSLSVAPGEFISLLGPSGCGKSTLLRILAGLDSLSEGALKSTLSTNHGFVFQEPCLLPWLNVFENVGLGISDKKLSSSAKKEEILTMLNVVKLNDRAYDFPHQLSGGMKMRVSIARALVNKKSVLFMDEPFAALDDFIRFELQEELLEFSKNHGLTVFFVTHSITESVFLSKKLWLFPQGPSSQFSEMILIKPDLSASQYRESDQYFKTLNQITDRLRVRI